MSKELTPLEWLNYYKRIVQESNKTFRPNGFELIEKDLLFVELLKNTFKFGVGEQKIDDTKLNMEVIAEKLTNEYDKQIRDFILKKCFPKELKALEIIKNKKVNVKELKKCDSVGKYNYRIYKEEEKLTQEEYDLLKEVLL